MLRWGILSTAKIGIEQLIPAIQSSENGVVTAIASRDPDRAANVANRFAIPHAFGSYDQLLSSDQVDAVYIPLPSSQHVEWSIKAAEAGKHVLCEKPIALHADEIDALIAARDQHQLLVSEAFMVTYHPQWHHVRRLIADGAIGNLRHVQAVFTYFNTDPDNIRNRQDLGGGALPDIGVYPVVTTRFASGKEAQRVSATVERDANFGTDKYASCRVDFGDFEMTMMVSTQLAHRQGITFHGDQGWIEVAAPFNAGLYDADTVTLHDTRRRETKTFHFAGVNQYRLQVEAFARAVASGDWSGNEEIFALESSRSNQRVIDAAYRSGKSNNWETVQD